MFPILFAIPHPNELHRTASLVGWSWIASDIKMAEEASAILLILINPRLSRTSCRPTSGSIVGLSMSACIHYNPDLLLGPMLGPDLETGMVRAVNRLSSRGVATLKKPGRHADGGGLYLAISANGSRRRWVFLFRWKTPGQVGPGKLTEMGLGSAGSVGLAGVPGSSSPPGSSTHITFGTPSERAESRARRSPVRRGRASATGSFGTSARVGSAV